MDVAGIGVLVKLRVGEGGILVDVAVAGGLVGVSVGIGEGF